MANSNPPVDVGSTDAGTPAEGDAGVGSFLEVRNELYRRLDAGIAHILSLFPATGADSDAMDVLDSVRKSASRNIPQPPTAAQAVLSLCQRRDYSLHELTELIERDPSLSAALLRHANSAWYGSADAGRVVGLRAAVRRAGCD